MLSGLLLSLLLGVLGNYVSEVSGDTRCYACTDFNMKKLTLDFRDPTVSGWLRWKSIGSIQQSPQCGRSIEPPANVNALSKDCDDGHVCVKVTFEESEQEPRHLRTCLPNDSNQSHEGCVTESNAAGRSTVCACVGNLCNN